MPPPFVAVFPEIRELLTVRVPLVLLKMPPPRPELFAPIPDTTLPDIVELETVRVPELLKPPPLPEVIRAPETVTPEMLRLPPEAMLKILKLRPLTPLSPLIVSTVAPRPVMVTVPAVPPETEVFALTIVGNALASVMV